MTRNEFDPVVLDRLRKLSDKSAAMMLFFLIGFIEASNDDFAAALRRAIADRLDEIDRQSAVPKTFLGV